MGKRLGTRSTTRGGDTGRYGSFGRPESSEIPLAGEGGQDSTQGIQAIQAIQASTLESWCHLEGHVVGGAEDTQTGYSWDHLAGYDNLGPFHGTFLGNGFSGGRVGKYGCK